MVITGAGQDFCAGGDIANFPKGPVDFMERIGLQVKGRKRPIELTREIPKPIIAMVNGLALGAGMELAMACDMIIASETAKFGQPEINLGVMPGAGGTQRLTHAVGKALAMEVVLNNRTLNAQEAAQYGLVNRVVPVELYLEEALKLANELAARAPIAIRLAKEAVNQAFESSLSEGIAAERRNFYFLFATEDQKEGMQAFLDKREPVWKAR